jgi:hypothetical protein
MLAPKINNSGIIPICKETFTIFPHCFDNGRKSLSKSRKSKVNVATGAPSGIPGVDIIGSAPEGTELDEMKLISVFRTP